MTHRLFFSDRDRTVNEDVWATSTHIRPVQAPSPGREAIRLLNEHGIKVVVVTNQSGVARGYFPESLVRDVHRKMEILLEAEGARLDGGLLLSPSPRSRGGGLPAAVPVAGNPGPGMMEQAAVDLDLSATGHYVVGDRKRRHGVRPGDRREVRFLVLTGYGKGEWELTGEQWKAKPDRIVEDLYEAVQWILARESIKIPKKRRKQGSGVAGVK